jgi:hypothetical protein
MVNAALALALVASLFGYRLWQGEQTLRVTSVSVDVAQHSTGCRVDADVTGVITTAGGPGDVTYKWRRDDGTTSAVETVHVGHDAKPTEVHLTWTFTGYGSRIALITLVVLTPDARHADYTVRYQCG